MTYAGISNLGTIEIEILEVIELGYCGKSLVGDLGVVEVQTTKFFEIS